MPHLRSPRDLGRADGRSLRVGKTLITAVETDEDGNVVHPVSLAEVKDHLRIETDPDDQRGADDSVLRGNLDAIVEALEEEYGYALMTQTWDFTYDRFPWWNGPLLVPKPPLQSITSITYLDANGATQTMPASEYIVDTSTTPARIEPAPNEDWPDPQDRIKSVTVRAVVGYGNAPDVPARWKLAIKLSAGHYYENRENSSVIIGGSVALIPDGVRHLLATLRLPGVR